MTLTERVRRIAEKKRCIDTIWEDVLLVQHICEQEGNANGPRIAAPMIYKYAGRALFPNVGTPNILELAYANMGEFLARYYPAALEHHFLTARESAARERAASIIEENMKAQQSETDGQ